MIGTIALVCVQTSCCTLLQQCDNILEESWDFESSLPRCKNIADAIKSGVRFRFNGPFVLPNCSLKWYQTQQACAILNSKFPNVVLLGDSFVRHMHNGMLVVLSGNAVDGAYKPLDGLLQAPNCTCERQFDDGHSMDANNQFLTNGAPAEVQRCRDATSYDSWNATKPICQNTDVHIQYSWYFSKTHLNRTLYVLGGRALQANFNVSMFEHELLLPVINMMSESKGDRIVCITTHSQGANKPVKFQLSQGNPRVLEFNAGMQQLCEKHGAQTLDFYGVTRNTTTWDGQHFGLTPNVLKAQIILNWIHNLE